MKPEKKTSNAKRVIFLPPALLLLLLLLLTGYFSYRATHQKLTHMVIASRQALAHTSAAILNERFGRLIDIGISIARRPQAVNLLAEGNADAAMELFKKGLTDFPFIERIFIADLGGNILADYPELAGAVGKNLAFRDWYQGVTRTWKPYLSEVHKRISKPQYNVAAVAIPILKDDGTKVGILVLQVRLETFLSLAEELPANPAEIVYFVDQKGQLAAHPKVAPEADIVDFSKVPAVQKALHGEAGVEEDFNSFDHQRELSSWAPVPEYHWAVVVTEPARVAFKERDDYLKLLLSVYAVVLLTSVFLVIVVVRSQRERKKTEELAREKAALDAQLAERKRAEERVRQIIESAPNGILMVGREGKITLVNSQIEKLFGYSREELMGQRIEMLVPERFRSKHPGYRDSFFADPKTRAVGAGRDLFGLKKDGTEIPIEIGLNPIETTEGVFTLASIIDITERKRAEVRLRRLATVVTDSNDAITVQDFEGKIIAWNRGAEKMYGYTESEARAMNIQETIPEAKRQEALEFMKRVQEEVVVVPSFETQRLTKDGRTLDVWLTVTKLVDETGKPVGIATTERDITEHKRAEQLLGEQKRNLEKANLELDSFVYTASHDLRAPVRAVSSFATFLEEDCKDKLDKRGQDHLNEIRKGADRMNELIDDLLTLSRISRIQNPYEDVDINQLVSSVLERTEYDVKASKVNLRIQKNLPTIHCDRIKLTEVFLNLIDNAIKFSSKNNKEEPKMEIGYTDKPNEHEFYVKDNGIGIDPEYHDQIFVLFKRLHTAEEYEGTGAGLSIVKRIVEDHDGRVWLKSELGKGATFFFTIPKGLEKRKKLEEILIKEGIISEE